MTEPSTDSPDEPVEQPRAAKAAPAAKATATRSAAAKAPSAKAATTRTPATKTTVKKAAVPKTAAAKKTAAKKTAATKTAATKAAAKKTTAKRTTAKKTAPRKSAPPPEVDAAPAVAPEQTAIEPPVPSHAVVALLPAAPVDDPVEPSDVVEEVVEEGDPQDGTETTAATDDEPSEPAIPADPPPSAGIPAGDDDPPPGDQPSVDVLPAPAARVQPRRRLVLAGSVASLVALAGVSWAFSRGAGAADSAVPVPGSTEAVVSLPASGASAPDASAGATTSSPPEATGAAATSSAKATGSGTASAKPATQPTLGSSIKAENGVIERITLVGVRSYTTPSASNGRKPLLGRFIRVTLSIKVTGSGSVPFDPMTAFYLRDVHGEQYAPYGMAAATETSGDPLRARTLKPGTRITGTVTFDAPGEPLTLIYATQDGGRIVATWPISA